MPPAARPRTAAARPRASAARPRSSEAAKQAPARKKASHSGRRLFRFDRAIGTRLVAGADEAGRGCLAGPLVAAAVLFDLQKLTPAQMRSLSELDDSKQHTPEARERIYPLILASAKRIAIVTRSARSIDSFGLHRTNLAALADALREVAHGCGQDLSRLVDGFSLPDLELPHRAVIGGDARSASIAAASIVAKVTRDRYMRHADALHPGWSFAQHVGYSTPEHREAIVRLGPSPLHRMSFQSVAYMQLELV
jgi:ribonuclease HII